MPSTSLNDCQDHENTIKKLKEEIEERKVEKEKLAARYDEKMVTLLEEIDGLKSKIKVLEETANIQEEVADNLRTKLIEAEDRIYKLKHAFVLVDNYNNYQDDVKNASEGGKKEKESIETEEKDKPTNDKDDSKKEKPILVQNNPTEWTLTAHIASRQFLFNFLLFLVHLVGLLINFKIAFQ